MLSVSDLYPAESHRNLRLLHEKIISSSSPDHYKHSALYYLLKDLQKYSHQSPRDFASASYLPGKYRTFVDGIWQLDRFEFEVEVINFLMLTPLTACHKESFGFSHRACSYPYIPRGNTIHSLSACSQCYPSNCLLPIRLACNYIGQSPRDLLPDPLSRQHHRSIPLLPHTRRSKPSNPFRKADRLRPCKLSRSN